MMGFRQAFAALVAPRTAVAMMAFAATLTLFQVDTAFGQGGQLGVAPTRVVLEGRDRSAQLSLVNKGSKSATFRIRVVNMRMGETGSMTEIDKPDPGQQFADKLFRYSPRQVTLKPGGSQAIRILLRKPKDLPAGEYRSHLMMQSVPDESGVSLEAPKNDQGVAIRLVPIFAITIPVIVRHGKTSFGAKVSDLSIVKPDEQNTLSRLKFTVSREGNRSAFGDFTATYVNGGDKTILAEIKRIAVYTPNTKRTIMLPLRVPDGVQLSGGSINLTFNQTEEGGGKLISEASLAVQ